MTICENCGGESRQRRRCPDCGKMVCFTCRYYLGVVNLAGLSCFCEHGNPPYWKTVPLVDVIEDKRRR